MNLAIILGICLLCPSGTPLGINSLGGHPNDQGPPASTPAPSPGSQDAGASPASRSSASQPKAPAQAQTPPPTTGQGQTSASPSTPVPKKPRRRRKATIPNCPDSTTPSKPAAGQPPPAPTAAGSTALSPCPPKKTVIRNGGASDSSVKLTGSDPAKPASQSTTAQLLAATEENLQKLSGRELNADQQQVLSQIHQFMEQSKQATAAGDVDRAQNLASKARLLSDELVKP
jgi:hypothetical protein